MYKHYYRTLVVVLLFLNTNLSFACDCSLDGSFFKVAYNADLVTIVKIDKPVFYEKVNGKRRPTAMQVEILDVLKGKEEREVVTIWGNNGLQCRPYIDSFQKNTIWVMALKADGTGKFDQVDYTLSNCGEQFLLLTVDNMIAGRVKSAEYTQWTLNEFKVQSALFFREQVAENVVDKLFKKGIDTVLVLETSLPTPRIRIKPDARTSVDPLYGAFFMYIRNYKATEQKFVFWKNKGKAYVQQINNYFIFPPVEITDMTTTMMYTLNQAFLHQELTSVINHFGTATETLPEPQQSIKFFTTTGTYACSLEALQAIGNRQSALLKVINAATTQAATIQTKNLLTSILFNLFKHKHEKSSTSMVLDHWK